MTTALLIVDVQNDFCAGGALAVPGGDEVVEPLSRLAREVKDAGGPVFASRDWHPPATIHFKEWGGKWPPHCVQGTEGAQFHPDLRLPEGTVVISAGTTFDDEGYSSFDGRDDEGKTLAEHLTVAGVDRLLVGGLATDYCVRASVLDARAMGLRVDVLQDAIRAVDVEPGDGDRAIAEMEAAGARLTDTAHAIARLHAREGATT